VNANHPSRTTIRTNHFQFGMMKASRPLVEPQTGGSYDDFVMARLDPDNRTGAGGEDILSRNFNWSLPLVSMTGRSGLNLGLLLSYNSLVWTRAGNYITYDADNGYPTPGFRLGFPVIYGTHYNSQVGAYGYLMLTPSGGRVELRRVGSTNTYEAADSSYLQLTDYTNGSLLVRSTDGTQLSYVLTTNGYRCTQVKDRNGNFLSITNSGAGRILSVTDTLGRVFNFNYDTNNNLSSISQTRGSSQYTWITFGYSNLTLQTNFTGLTIIGTQSGTTLPVLSQVGLADGTFYRFSYNSWGQVYKTTYYAADSLTLSSDHVLNYVAYNLPPDATTAQTDCPRFTQRKDWAENWNNSNEAVTNYTAPATGITWTMPGGGTQSGTFCQRQTPDGTYSNVYSHSSGWDEGMPVLVNTWANNDQSQLVLQRQETSTYTQDNTSLGYMLNPRVLEKNIYDPSGNHKRTSVSYTSFALSCGTGCSATYYLPNETKEYAANATSVLRTTQTDYNLSSDYTNRRMIGLASQKRVYDTANSNALLSKVDYIYDDGGEYLVQQGTPVQHDSANFGTSFVTGRGNLTRTRRWDVINTSQSLESKTGYNTTGSPIFTRSPLQTADTQANVSYTDSFSDGQNRNTYAYPTELTIKDTVGTTPAVSISNKKQYNYDLDVVTRTEGPPPANQSQGAIVTNAYDSAGRLYQSTNAANGAYTYIIYPTSSNVIQTYVAIRDAQTLTVSSKLFDGAGRVRATAAEHPGSTGGYVAQSFVFDVMGRVVATSNPTEIYGSWQSAGDDAAGWVWSYQSYDWKGRPRVTTNQDGSTKEATYGGCGCAGGEVITVRDETGRKQRVTHDVLGRVLMSEDLELNGTDVYRKTTNTYNALDQVTQVFVQQGSSSTGLTATTTYDGYARLAASHTPLQSSGTSTGYTYNGDDTIATMTDARGVVTAYSYNNRHQTTGITYPNTQTQGSGVPETPASTFTYDAVGNRLSMTDGLGSASYSYDQLSRLTSESRIFTGVGTGAYTLSYGYNVAGQLTSITDPWNAQVGYTRDITGKILTVTGSGYAGQSQYATSYKYRAWGALKSLTYSNNVPLALSYNSRLQVSNYKLTSPSTLIPSPSMDIDYSYTADGRLRLSTDHKDATLDRAYGYDQSGRLASAYTGNEARSWVQNGNIGTTVDGPYRQTYTFDVQNNMTSKVGRSFTGTYLRNQTVSYTYDQSTGRNTSWYYDADGRVVSGDGVFNTYDEAGYLRAVNDNGNAAGAFDYDGNGQKAKKYDIGVSNPSHTYYLRSSVVGQTISEIESLNGARKNGFVYADGELIATQAGGVVYWQHTDPSDRSRRTTISTGDGVGTDEVDPQDVKVDVPDQPQHNTGTGGGAHAPGGTEAHVASLMSIGTCDFAGMAVPCAMVGDFKTQLGSLSERMQDHWNGITTWDISVSAKFKNVTLVRKLPARKAGLFAYTSQSFVDRNLTPALFTQAYAEAAASGLIGGDDEGLAKTSGGTGDKKKYKRELNEDEAAKVEEIADLARQAIANPDCAAWLTSGSKWAQSSPLEILNALISTRHFFYGGKPGSFATTYANFGLARESWIGLRRAFFQDGMWGQVNTILHELRHAVNVGMLGHPEQFKNDAEKVAFLEAGGGIETQELFNKGVEQNCIIPLRNALQRR
jgi:YD repeat-containing protein